MPGFAGHHNKAIPMKKLLLTVLLTASITSFAFADAPGTPFSFSTGFPDMRLATASRPEDPANGKIEIESADDFIAPTGGVNLTSATFTGLLPRNFDFGNVSEVVVEIYRVFPLDSDVSRTSGPPTFSTSQVPTRVNSPSDVAFDTRDSGAGGGLNFNISLAQPNVTAANSILNGINPKPNQATMGEGSVTGNAVTFNVTFTHPFSLPAGHYFFVPQVELPGPTDNFFWLSTARPPLLFTGDLQAWIRNANLDPDWLREGTDIIDGASPAPTFNEAFSLTGTIPDSGSTALLLGSALTAVFYLKRRIRA